MGQYAEVDDVLSIMAVSVTGVDSATVEVFLRGAETRVNSALRGRGYQPIQPSDPNDLPMVKDMVIRKAAAVSWLSVFGSQDVPGWIEAWNAEFESWLAGIRNGEILLLDQPAVSSAQVRRHRLRVLPKEHNVG